MDRWVGVVLGVAPPAGVATTVAAEGTPPRVVVVAAGEGDVAAGVSAVAGVFVAADVGAEVAVTVAAPVAEIVATVVALVDVVVVATAVTVTVAVVVTTAVGAKVGTAPAVGIWIGVGVAAVETGVEPDAHAGRNSRTISGNPKSVGLQLIRNISSSPEYTSS